MKKIFDFAERCLAITIYIIGLVEVSAPIAKWIADKLTDIICK